MGTPEDTSNEKRIALWPGKDRKSDSNKPWLTGRFQLDGKPFFVTLWKRDRRSDREPILSGHIAEASDEELEET